MDLNFISSVLFVKDINSSRQFYEGFLQLKVESDHGPNIAYFGGLSIWQIDHAYENIFRDLSNDQIKEKIGYQYELYFETENIHKVFNSAVENKIEIMHGITKHPWEQEGFRVYDPDHNIIEIGESMQLVMERINKA